MQALTRGLNMVAALLFAAALLLVNAQIVCRFILSISVPWTEEVSRLVFVWLAFLGAAIGAREGSLIVIDTLPEVVGPKWDAWIGPLVRLVSLAVVLFRFVGSTPLVRSVWPTTLSTVDWISNGWAYLAFTTSFGLMALFAAYPIVRDLMRLGGRRI